MSQFDIRPTFRVDGDAESQFDIRPTFTCHLSDSTPFRPVAVF